MLEKQVAQYVLDHNFQRSTLKLRGSNNRCKWSTLSPRQ